MVASGDHASSQPLSRQLSFAIHIDYSPGVSIDHARYKQLAMQWKRAAPLLAAARRDGIRRQNAAQAIDSLNSLFREAIKRKKPSRSSGFVEMYRILRRSGV